MIVNHVFHTCRLIYWFVASEKFRESCATGSSYCNIKKDKYKSACTSMFCYCLSNKCENCILSYPDKVGLKCAVANNSKEDSIDKFI